MKVKEAIQQLSVCNPDSEFKLFHKVRGTICPESIEKPITTIIEEDGCVIVS